MGKVFYSGCNFMGNHGDCEEQPVGTVTALHECTGCEMENYCLLKQETLVFPMNEDKKSELDALWERTLALANKY